MATGPTRPDQAVAAATAPTNNTAAVRAITSIDRSWIAAAFALELAANVSHAIVYTLLIDRRESRDARRARTDLARGRLVLPGGGVADYLIGGRRRNQPWLPLRGRRESQSGSTVRRELGRSDKSTPAVR